MGTVSDLIHTHTPEILEAWTKGAEQAVSARALSVPELAGVMPRFLALLGHGAAVEEAVLTSAQLALIESHLGNRLREGFDLHELVTELAVLGRCVSAVIEKASGDARPTVADVAELFMELHLTSVAVTRIFNEHLLEDEQTMKRYVRFLDGLAHDVSSLGAGQVRDRLAEVVAVVYEAMEARAVVVLLVDSWGDRPTVAASAGDGGGALELYTRSLEATSFGGVAGVADSSGTLKLPAALHLEGVGSLLRVGHQGRRFCYVMYVAIRAERPFTASELRRAEGMCRALTLHLDNAQLHLALTEKTEELRVEREHRERMIAILVRAVRGPLATARANASRLLEQPSGLNPAAIETIEALSRLERVVDDLLATTPAVRPELAR